MMVALFSLVRIWGECSTIHSLSAFFFFFPEGDISSCTPIPLFRPRSVHSGLASWDDCGRVFPDKLYVSWFLDMFTLHLDSGIVSPLQLCWVKDVCMCGCNLPPALLAGWLRSFTCHCGNMGMKRTPIKSQHTKLTMEKKILPPLLLGFEVATFRLRVRRSD